MVAFYLVLLFLGLAIFTMAIFGNLDHDFSVGDHDFSVGDHDLGGDQDFNGDNEADAHSASPGLFSVRTISALFAGFGVAGLVSKLLLGWGTGGQLLLGFGTGIALAGLAYLIMLGFYSQQAGGVNDSNHLVGRSGIVTVGSGNQGIGEIRVDNLYFTCKEKDSKILSLNQAVKVLESQNGLLIVEKL